MNINEHIEIVRSYYVNKILDGDFLFIKLDGCRAEIVVEEKRFFFWMRNIPEICCDFCDLDNNYTIFKLEDDEKLRVWLVIAQYCKDEILRVAKKDMDRDISRESAYANVTKRTYERVLELLGE